MAIVTMELSGSFDKTESWLQKAASGSLLPRIEQYGQAGVQALASATPQDSGKTAMSWGYNIRKSPGTITIEWTNSHYNKGVPIAIILQYGHGTGTGGYVQGRDYLRFNRCLIR